MTKLNQFMICDELPFWSAPIGQLLLDTIRYPKNARILDIGSGSGFPMLELAMRFGEGSTVTGIDPPDEWKELAVMTGFKIQSIQLDGFRYRFATAEAFFSHYFIRTAFRPTWYELFPESRASEVTAEVISRMERSLRGEEGIGMSVPFACFDLLKHSE